MTMTDQAFEINAKKVVEPRLHHSANEKQKQTRFTQKLSEI